MAAAEMFHGNSNGLRAPRGQEVNISSKAIPGIICMIAIRLAQKLIKP